MNATSIFLIPKVANPTRLIDFHPISCCNTVYKCIAEILAGRIKAVLPSLVCPYQTAFICGWRISNNILLSQELIKGYHKSTGPAGCAMKVDLMKAYDSVRWDFIDATLITVIDWIMVCVTSCQFSINVNGELAGYFQGGERAETRWSTISIFVCPMYGNPYGTVLQEGQNFSSLFCRRLDDFEQRGCKLNSYDQNVLTEFQDLLGLYPNPNKSDIFLHGSLGPERE
jgi:hypothetical protein